MHSPSQTPGNVQHFTLVEAVRAEATVQSAVRVLRGITALEHVTFHMVGTISGCYDAPYVKSTYPAEWLAYYLLHGCVNVDPVVHEGFLRRLPFHWDELEVPDTARAFMEDARRYGIGSNGYSIPIIDREGRRSLFSMTSSITREQWREYIDKHGDDLVEAAHVIHRKAVAEIYGEDFRFPHLSQREIECLSWTAQGKDAGTISLILHLSENTVRAYLKSVRYKLDCSTLSQAVAKAIRLRIITP